jgi:hypothetical protein
MLCRRSCKPMVNVNRMRVPCSRFRAESGKRVPQIPHANMHYVNVEQLETSKMGNDVQCYKDQTLSQALHCQEQHLWARRTSPKKMATTKKDLYVGTDKHRWWKEAVVYQVCRIEMKGKVVS